MSTIFKTTALAFATSSLLIAGCGGSSSDGGSAPRVEPTGKAIDFYLSGATVTFDGCGGATRLTNATGGFNFPENCFQSNVTVTGGTDIGTGLPFTGVLRALAIPGGSEIIVSPITTIISYTDAGIANTAKFAAQLGLEDKNFLLIDPMTNSSVLKTTVVTQQLLNQIQSVLTTLGVTDPKAASMAATKALSEQMVKRVNDPAITTPGLTETAFIQAVVESSVLNAKANLNFTDAEIAAVAKNTAAIAAATIQQKVRDVSDAMQNFEVKGTPAATLQALQDGGQTATIKDASLSQAGSEAVAAISELITNANPATAPALATLGAAIASGNTTAIENAAIALNNILPVDQQLSADIIDDLKDIETYTDFIRLNSAGFNGNPSVSINQLTSSTANAPVTVNGGFNSVQLDMTKIGQPFKAGFSEAKVGLSYTVNNVNKLNIVVSNVDLGFDAAGKLTSASVPKGAKYSFTTAGSQTTNVDSTNLTIDNLTVTNGVLSLPVTGSNGFLDKASSKSPTLKNAIASYMPKTGDKVSIQVTMGATQNTSVRVGTAGGNPAPAITIDAGAASVLGQGVNAQLAIQ